MQEVTVRSDHLEAVIKYAIEQTTSSHGQINVLAFGDNQNAVGEGDDASANYLDQLNALACLLQATQAAIHNDHCDLILLPLPAHYRPVEAYTYELDYKPEE